LPNILKISDKDNFKKKFLEYKDHIISLMNSTENFKKKLVDEIQNNLLDNIDYDKIKKLQKDYAIYEKEKAKKNNKKKKHL
jgi:regulator of replication initiation timing